MREETDQYPDPSSKPSSEIYDTSIVDSLDLQSLSLNYPPIKPGRREDIPPYSSSSSSNGQDSFPRQVNIEMFPAWFFDCSQRERSPNTQVMAGTSDTPGLSSYDSLPSYNDLYELDNPGQSTSTSPRHPTSGCRCVYPLVGGLASSGWENNDPGSEACFAAVSSASRSSEAMGSSRNDHREGDETSEARNSDQSRNDDQLIDLDNSIVSNRFPPTHRPDYPGHSSSLPLTPSRPMNSMPKSPYEGEHDQKSNESMGSYDPGFESSLNSTSGVVASKRKYDDVAQEYQNNEGGYAGPSTQLGWKRPRTHFPSSTPEDEYDESPTHPYSRNDGNTLPTSIEIGEEWQGDSLTADTPDTGEMQSNSSRSDIIHRDVNHPDQDPNGASSSQDDTQIHYIPRDSIELEVNSGGHQQYSDNNSQQYREGSDRNPAIEGIQWPSDGLTVVDPSADWLGHVPVRTFQSPSDDAMDQSGSETHSQSPVHPADIRESQLSPESQMAVEPPSALPSDDSLDVSLQRLNTRPEHRKRPAEEIDDTTPSPIRKKSRRPASKIILAKALPKLKSPVPSSPQSSPTRPGNTALGMKPRKPWNSAPNRPANTASSAITDPHKNLIIDKGPVEFFASLKTSKKVATVKQKAFKSPLAGGGVTLKPKDPNQPSTSINYGTANPGSSTSNMSIAGRLAILEKEARTLRQAVKYQNESEEDERLQDLIIQWRTAGRDVVEQIFDRIPKPTETDEVKQARNPWMTSGRDDIMELTDEQEKWLKNCDKNEDGEPIDEEGNPLIPGPQSNDLRNLMEEASKPRRGEKEGYHLRYDHGSTGRRPVQAEAREWNMGTMMIKMSVDPALLGWDDDLEDWVDSDSL